MTDALAVAAEVLEHWGIDAVRLEALPRSENIVFRTEDRAGLTYVLRLHRPDYHTLDELESEHEWTAALIASGIDVPVPRLTLAGEAYTECRLHGERRYVGLLEWVDGAPMRELIEDSADADFIAGCYRELGKLMASLHAHAAAWQPPPGFTRPALDADGLVGDTPFWGRFWESPALDGRDRRWLAGLRLRIRDVLLGYGQSPDHYSLIHADLHPGNVIVNGRRLHIIDFDDAAFGWHLYDLAVALLPYRRHLDFERNRAALIAGYREVRALSDETLELLPLFIVIRALAQIGWFAARPEHESDAYLNTVIEYTREHAEAVVSRIEG